VISGRASGLADNEEQDRPMATLSACCSIVAGHIQKLQADNKGATAIVTVQALGTKVTALYDSLAAMM
jgi:hypothetical protein